MPPSTRPIHVLLVPPLPVRSEAILRGYEPVTEAVALRRNGERSVLSNLDGRLRIESSVKWRRRTLAERRAAFDALPNRRPGPLPPKVNLGGLDISLAPGYGMRVAGGWLSAWAEGEFGGGLLHVADLAGTLTVVSEVNTVALTRIGACLFAVQYLDVMESGRALFVEVLTPDRGRPDATDANGWQVRTVAEIGHRPSVTADGDRFLLAEGAVVRTLEIDGTGRDLYFGPKAADLGSIAVLGSDVWVAARGTLLRLRPTSGGAYVAQWFAPSARR